jgi:hypothetical protein
MMKLYHVIADGTSAQVLTLFKLMFARQSENSFLCWCLGIGIPISVTHPFFASIHQQEEYRSLVVVVIP